MDPTLRALTCLSLLLISPSLLLAEPLSSALPDAPQPTAQTLVASAESSSSSLPQDQQAAAAAAQSSAKPTPAVKGPVDATGNTIPLEQQQPKRILGLMPNFRAVSAGQVAPPPTSKEAFKIATENSFDYSSFVFTGLTSLLAKGTDAHPDLGKGADGLWDYTWRGFLDKTDGNYLVIWALPTVFHEDERYYAMGHGSKWRRLGYSLLSVPMARNYEGHHVANCSELLGRAGAQAISTAYYPTADSNLPDLAAKYFYALLRDGATNSFREFYPDIAAHYIRKHREKQLRRQEQP